MAALKSHTGKSKPGAARKRRPKLAAPARQITKKPIPRIASEWHAEYEGVLAHLGTLDQYEPAYGAQWVASMQRYWRLRLADLRNFPPRGVAPPPAK